MVLLRYSFARKDYLLIVFFVLLKNCFTEKMFFYLFHLVIPFF